MTSGGGDASHAQHLKAMLDLSTIQISSTTYRYESKSRAEETLALAIETAGPGETFDIFDNGRGLVIRMFEDGEFVSTI